MIYLFDRQKKLQKIIPKKHLLSAIQTVELNGLYQLSVEVPLFYETKEGTQYNHKKSIENAWFVGHYDRQKRFQLYKIHARKISVKNDGTKVIIADGVHIFFDEAKAMGNIHDRRFRDSDVKAPADAAFNSIGWHVIDYDVTDRADINFYRDSVANARSLIIEKYGVEFDYDLTFDGRKIISKGLYIKKRLGRWTGKRFAYGSNLLSLTQEQDESEVYTAAVGRGKGEQSGDGHGPRVEFSDIEWSKDGITKPVGQNWIEIPSATLEYGFYEDEEIKPRFAPEVIFENTENKQLLADSTYYWLLENCVPKATWETDVAKSGIHDLGDSVGVIYKKADIVKIARVHKMENNLLDDALSKITLGDYQHFKTDKRQQSIKAQIKRNHADNQSVITQMKNDFDARFDAQTTAIDNAYQQAVIDANANIQASEVRMQDELDTQRQQMTENINTAKQNAIDVANQNLQQVTETINNTIDTNRQDVMEDITTAKTEAIQQAEVDAKAKADAVQSNLDSFEQTHQQLYDSVTADIMDIDTFLGEKDYSLDWHLNSLREEMQDQINAVNTANPNLIVGSTLENLTDFENYGVGESQIHTEESMNYIRTTPISEDSGIFGYFFPSTVHLIQGNSYTLGIDFRSETVEDLDYIYLWGPYTNVPLRPIAQLRGLTADGTWNRYYFKFDWVDTTRDSQLLIATNTNYGDIDYGWFDTRRAMLYEGNLEVPWSPSPSDNSQIITQLNREISELEDGLKSKATKTEFDLLSQDYTQFTNEFTTTAERWESELQEHDNWLNSNGSNLLQMADRVQSKVWLNDFSEVNPNLIPFADTSNRDNLTHWGMWNGNANAIDSLGEYVVRSTNSSSTLGIESEVFDVTAGDELVLSVITRTSDGWQTQPNFTYTYLINEDGTNQFLGSPQEYQQMDSTRRRNIWKFTADFTGEARILIGTYTMTEGVDARFSFKEPKLERGTERTPFMNAFSNVEQLANSLKLQVQELDGTFLSQSDIQINPGYVKLGSQRLGDSQLASILKVSPESIDVITDEMNLTGNLNVKGQIESISMSAVEAEFGSLFASELSATTIDVDHISGKNGWFLNQYIQNANIERLTSQHIFTDAIHTKSLDAIDANFGRVQTAILKADVIENMHLSSNSVEVDNIRMTHALAEKIMANTVMANEVKAMSVNAVYADLRSVNSEIMTSNIIKSNWLDVDTALFNRFTASSAFISSLTAKTAFIRDIQAIEINTSQLNVDTIMEQGGNIAGGISIRRPDGAYAVNNGMLRNEYVVNAYNPNFMTATSQGLNAFYQSGEWWVTSRRIRQDAGKLRFNAYQFVHSARYLEIEIGYRRHQTNVFFEIDSFGSYSFNKTYSQFQDGGGSTEYHVMRVDLGVPDYKRKSFYFYAYPNSTGDESDQMWFRILRVVQTDF